MTDESGFQMKFDETLFYYEFCCQCVKDLLKKKDNRRVEKKFYFAEKIQVIQKSYEIQHTYIYTNHKHTQIQFWSLQFKTLKQKYSKNIWNFFVDKYIHINFQPGDKFQQLKDGDECLVAKINDFLDELITTLK